MLSWTLDNIRHCIKAMELFYNIDMYMHFKINCNTFFQESQDGRDISIKPDASDVCLLHDGKSQKLEQPLDNPDSIELEEISESGNYECSTFTFSYDYF